MAILAIMAMMAILAIIFRNVGANKLLKGTQSKNPKSILVCTNIYQFFLAATEDCKQQG